ncbi:MAG: FadR/GntR family transcriptional regulator [Leucobacter sp.]
MSRVSHALRELQKLIDAAEPGMRLGSKSELAERLGVAPGTLNQATRLLQNRGSLELRPGPGGGLFVAAPNPLEALSADALTVSRGSALRNDAIRVRGALDQLVIEDVMDRVTPAGDARVRGVLAQLAEAARDKDGQRFSALTFEFQLVIAEQSEYEFARLVFRTAVQLIQDSTPALYTDADDLVSVHAAQERLWQGILDKDMETVMEIVRLALKQMGH